MNSDVSTLKFHCHNLNGFTKYLLYTERLKEAKNFTAQNTHLFPVSLFKNFRFLFSNTSPPPGFAGALIIVDNSALWLFLFTYNCSTFEEKISQKGSFRSNGLTQTAVCCWYSHTARLDCSANLRAHRLGHHRQAARRGVARRTTA